MKKLILSICCFTTVSIYAQGLKLETGKKIISVSNSMMDMDMGIAGKMKISSTFSNMIVITGVDDKNYKATSTTTKLTISQEGMGQTVNFDSDKKEDNDSEIGKEIGKMVNAPVDVTIDKNSGKVTETNKKVTEEDNINPMAGLMGGGAANSAEVSTSAAFFYLPAGKKMGDTWSDSVTSAGMKDLKNYELKAINGNVATINFKSITKGSISKELQGMQLEITMAGTGDGTMLVDTKTNLVKKTSVNNNVEGTMEMMGQSIPLTMKTTASSTFE